MRANAADEVAVAAFLGGRIVFTEIPEVIDRCLDTVPGRPMRHFEELFETDEAARRHAEGLVEELAVADLGSDDRRLLGVDHLHEFGHFVVAKWTGMRVERFFLFFPKAVERRRDRVRIGAIPLEAS